MKVCRWRSIMLKTKATSECSRLSGSIPNNKLRRLNKTSREGRVKWINSRLRQKNSKLKHYLHNRTRMRRYVFCLLATHRRNYVYLLTNATFLRWRRVAFRKKPFLTIQSSIFRYQIHVCVYPPRNVNSIRLSVFLLLCQSKKKNKDEPTWWGQKKKKKSKVEISMI